MKKYPISLACTTAGLVHPQVSQAKPVSVNMARARATALHADPGRIEKSERERDGGGVRYSFDIRQGDRIHEIGVDVVTAQTVEAKFEALNAKD